jgi:predicted dehydrogenase
MKKWKIVIIGAGYMAEEHAKAFASLNNVEFVGIYSRTFERAEKLAGKYQCSAFCSIREMYSATQADAVVIAVNELSMLQVYLESFSYPWICFIEKPVGINYSEAKVIVESAETRKAKVYVALNRRAYSSTRQAMDLLEKNDGGARLISITDQQDLESVRLSGQPEEVVKNYMYANSIHLIDYFNFFARGEVVSVNNCVAWNSRNPRYVVSTIHFSSGDTGVYQAVWDGPGPWSVNITNSNVRVELRPLERFAYQLRGERKLLDVEVDEIDIQFKPGLYYQATQVITLLEGKKACLASLSDAYASMKLCSDIYKLS